jgi:YVTN family beta-propeller protein
MYVANFGNATVGVISAANNLLTSTIPVGQNPVALAETPDAKKLYAVNQGSGTVTSINTVDKSVVATIAVGSTPVWAVARTDSARVYVLNQGSGTVSVIDTSSDTVLNTASVGAGANFMLYDKTRNRLYVTNPAANTLTVLDVAVDPPSTLFVVPVPASPVSVAALPDGSRVYVGSTLTSAGNESAQVTIVNASDGTIRGAQTLSTVTAVCDPNTRFRVFVAASADNSKVYVANCDAGNTTIIRTSDDAQVLDMPAPVSAFPPPAPGEQPPPQNPVFVVSGP